MENTDGNVPSDEIETSLFTPDPKANPLVEVDGFRVLGLISDSGGMGVVYLAEQQRPVRRRVALKMIKPGMDSQEVIARFEAERQALALLNHPHIAQIYDAGISSNGRPFFVMEYVPGLPITEYSDQKNLDVDARLHLFLQVCGAVQHAHQKGIVHRDLKPSNVLVAAENDQPKVKIIDFGLARALNQRLTEQTLFTQLGQVVGTPGYMSPEQADPTSVDVDTRTDIFSMGTMIYELLIGVLPFDPADLRRAGYAEMQRIIREVEPPRPSMRLSNMGDEAAAIAKNRGCELHTLRRKVGGDLEWIILRAMEKDRSRRYPTAAQLGEDIRRYHRQEPVDAGPPSTGYRLGKFLRRNRSLVLSLTTILTILVAALVFMYELFDAMRESRNDAQYQNYVASLRLASLQLAHQDASRVRSILSETPEGPRDWEWDYLWNRSDQSLASLDSVGVNCLAVAPSGRLIAVGNHHGVIRVWDSETLHLETELVCHDERIEDLVFSPDGELLASATGTSTDIWSVSTKDKICELRSATSVVRSIAFSPDGETIVCGGFNEETNRSSSGASTRLTSGFELTLWNIAEASPLWTLEGFGGPVAWAPDGNRIVCGAESASNNRLVVVDARAGALVRELETNSLHLVDVRSGDDTPDGTIVAHFLGERFRGLVMFGPEHDWAGRTVSTGLPTLYSWGWSQTGKKWASASNGTEVALVDAHRGSRPMTMQGDFRDSRVLAFLPDGTKFVTGSQGGIKVWDATGWSSRWESEEHAGSSIAFSEDGSRLATGTPDPRVRSGGNLFDGSVAIWDVETMAIVDHLRGHPGHISAVEFGNRDEFLLVAADSSVRVVRLSTGKIEHQINVAEKVASAAFGRSDSDIVISTTRRNEPFDVDDYGVRRTLALELGTEDTLWVRDSAMSYLTSRAVAVSPDREYVAIPSSKGLVVCRTQNGEQISELPTGDVTSFAWEPSSHRLLSSSLRPGGSIELWDMDSSIPLRTWADVSSKSTVDGLAFSPSGRRFASIEAGGSVKVWDVSTGVVLLELNCGGLGDAIAFSPDGGSLVAVGSQLTAWSSTGATSGFERRRARELSSRERQALGP